LATRISAAFAQKQKARRVAGLSVALSLNSVRSASRQSETEQAQAEQRQRSGFGDYGGSDRERTNKRAATAAKQTTGGETPPPDEAITNPLGKELQRRGCNAWFNRDGSGIPVKRIYKEALGYVFQPEDWRDVAVRDAINHDIEAGHAHGMA
jgi:hypothetical protein